MLLYFVFIRPDAESAHIRKALMALRLLKFFKLPRMQTRLQRICEEARIDSSIFNMCIALMGLLLVWHYIACFYWYISEGQGFCTKEDFHHCLDYWSPSIEIVETLDVRTQYIQSLFWAVQATSSVGRDIIPETNVETMFTILVMVSIFEGVSFVAIHTANGLLTLFFPV
jgi:hypothetical protein